MKTNSVKYAACALLSFIATPNVLSMDRQQAHNVPAPHLFPHPRSFPSNQPLTRHQVNPLPMHAHQSAVCYIPMPHTTLPMATTHLPLVVQYFHAPVHVVHNQIPETVRTNTSIAAEQPSSLSAHAQPQPRMRVYNRGNVRIALPLSDTLKEALINAGPGRIVELQGEPKPEELPEYIKRNENGTINAYALEGGSWNPKLVVPTANGMHIAHRPGQSMIPEHSASADSSRSEHTTHSCASPRAALGSVRCAPSLRLADEDAALQHDADTCEPVEKLDPNLSLRSINTAPILLEMGYERAPEHQNTSDQASTSRRKIGSKRKRESASKPRPKPKAKVSTRTLGRARQMAAFARWNPERYQEIKKGENNG